MASFTDAGLTPPLESWYRDFFFRGGYPEAYKLVDAICIFPPGDDRPLINLYREHQCEAGRVDLLIELSRTPESQGGTPYAVIVCEFKRDAADEGAVAQVLRYVGCLKRERFPIIPREVPELIFGAVIAPKFTQGARWAAEAGRVRLISIHAEFEVSVSPVEGEF